MATVGPEPVGEEEARMALALRAVQARKYVEKGYTPDEAMWAANLCMLVMAYRTAVAESSKEFADDVEKFLESQ